MREPVPLKEEGERCYSLASAFFEVRAPDLTSELYLSADLIDTLLKLLSECWSREIFRCFFIVGLLLLEAEEYPELAIIPKDEATIFCVWLNLSLVALVY